MRILVASLLLLFPFSLFADAVLDEAPAKPGEWGFRPDGGAVEVNPPGFSWRPIRDREATYALQVAEDEGFTKLVCEAQDIPWPGYCPAKPLPEGQYYWRYMAKDGEGAASAWSKGRMFSVGAGAVVFPQPGRGEVAQRIPKEHPRLFFRPEDVPRFQELAKGELAGRYEELVKKADALLASPPDTTEPPLYPKGVSRQKTPAEWRKIWWGNRQRVCAVADSAALLGFVYRLNGDEKYARAAKDLLVAMAEWDASGSTKYSYNDEAAMPALYMTSRAYTWAYPAFSEKEREAVVAMMRERGEQAYRSLRSRQHLWRPYSSHHNRSWHFLGELAIAFHDTIAEAPLWLDYAMTIFYTSYPVWGDSDGGWHEGAAYWSSYTSRFMYWAYAAKAALDINVFERPFYSRVGDFGLYTMPPGTQTGAFGDQAILSDSRRISSLMAVLANGAKNPYWKWYADQGGGNVGGGYLGFIYAASAGGFEAKAPADLPSSVCFEGVGLAALNSNLLDGKDNVQLHFKSSPFGRQSHGYNANNAFLLNLDGERVFLRTGKRDLHGSPHHMKWMHETKSDNAILVNGQGQAPHAASATGQITVFETSPAVDVVVGEAGASYTNLDRWTRRIVFFKPHAILIHDVLDAPEPSTFEWLLHAKAKFEVEGQVLRWAGEPGSVEVRLLEPEGLVISQTDQYDVPPGDWGKIPWEEWHLTAQAAEKATHREFLSLIVIKDAAVAAELERGGEGVAVKLALPGREATVSLTPDGLKVQTEGFDKSF